MNPSQVQIFALFGCGLTICSTQTVPRLLFTAVRFPMDELLSTMVLASDDKGSNWVQCTE